MLVASREGYRNLCAADHADEARRAERRGQARRGARARGSRRRAPAGLDRAGRAAGARRPRGTASAACSIGSSACSAAIACTSSCSGTCSATRRPTTRRCVDLASAFRVPIVATNGVRFATPEERPLYDVLTCIRHKTDARRGPGGGSRANAERYLKSPAQMARLFADLPQALAGTARARRAARVHAGRSRLSLSRLSGAGRRDAGVVPAPAHRRRRARSLPAVSTIARARRSRASSI